MLTLILSVTAAGVITLSGGGKTLLGGAVGIQGQDNPTSRTAVQDSPTHATITALYPGGVQDVCVVSLSGNDLTLTDTVTSGSTVPSNIGISFYGLVANSANGSTNFTGTIKAGSAYFPQDYHPNLGMQVGCVSITDGAVAYSAYMSSEAGRQYCISSSYPTLNGFQNPSAPAGFNVNTTRTLGVNDTEVVTQVFRVTDDLSIPGIYSGYKTYLDALYSGLPRVYDKRPAMSMVSIDQSFIRSDNPGGFNDGGNPTGSGLARRPDLPGFAAAFESAYMAYLLRSGAQGAIIWAPGGYWAEGMYPIRFGTAMSQLGNPTQFTQLAADFAAHGLRVGVCARPDEDIDPQGNYTSDIDPNNPAMVQRMLDQFSLAKSYGANMYYVDTFGATFSSAVDAPRIRAVVGWDVPMYMEYRTDVTLAYMDTYCRYDGSGNVQWSDSYTRQVLQYLFPKSVWLAVSNVGTPWPIPDYRDAGITPLIEDYLVPTVLGGQNLGLF